jgi:membrane associated rhomboid family serine protease
MNQPKPLTQRLKTQTSTLVGFLVLMWGLELLDVIVRGHFDRYGIIPRTLIGLRGILFAPFLHGNLAHLSANTLPFLILGWLVMLQGVGYFLEVTLIVMLVGGFGTWLIAAPGTIHVGASGLIFGYLGFLLFRGYFERRLISIGISLIVGVLYGGLIWGVLPTQAYVSWEGHLFGFIGGVIAARLLANDQLKPPAV